MRCKRTVRRPTRWTPDEWRRVEAAADARNVPTARFVREAVLAAVEDGASPTRPRPIRRRIRDELVHQLGRVLNNLRQLERIADDEGEQDAVRVAEHVSRAVEAAIRRAPTRGTEAAAGGAAGRGWARAQRTGAPGEHGRGTSAGCGIGPRPDERLRVCHAGNQVIGKAHRLGSGFKGLAAYLERGQLDRMDPDRVDWIESRNLPTRDPETAARLMAASARDSERVQKPVYHLSISFDPGDPVDRETMRRVADRTLRDLGLQEHQAVILAHKDRQHPHLHIMVNRVHPERGTAWSNSWDYRRIEQSLRQQEADLGLRVVPGKHAPVPEHARDRMEHAPQRVRGDAAFLERVRAEAGPHLTGARSWSELERGLAGHGLALRMKGRGMVVTDGAREVKASEIDAAASRFRLERRLGSFTDYRARQAVAGRALDERAPAQPTRTEPAREPQTRAQVQERTRAAPTPPTPPAPPAPERRLIPTGINREQRAREVQRAPTPADARPAPAPAERRARPTVREAARDFSREARALYADPAAARRAFLSTAERRGADRAAATFRDEPHRFGRLRPGADPARSQRAADAAFEYARQHAASERGALKGAATLFREVDAYERAARAVDRMADEAARAAREPARLTQVRRDGLHAVRTFREEAAHVYADPARAVRAVDAYRARFGADETARAIREAPDHFGALRGVESTRYFGFQRVTSYEAAHDRAKGLAETFRTAAAARAARPRAGDVHRAVVRSRESARALDAARAALRPVNVQGHVREAASRLMAAQIGKGPEKAAQLVARLLPMVPTSAAQLVRQAMQIGKDMALGHDRERERDRGLSL
jgi:hypothetical protein